MILILFYKNKTSFPIKIIISHVHIYKYSAGPNYKGKRNKQGS